MESFGLVKVKINTPYTKLARNYLTTDCDLIGLYSGYELFLYDSYTSRRIRSVSFLGQTLSWKHVVEVKTYSSDTDIAKEMALIITHEYESVYLALRKLIQDPEYTSEIQTIMETQLPFVPNWDTATVYKPTSEGIEYKELELEYNQLHNDFFIVLQKLNEEGADIFPKTNTLQTKIIQANESKLDKCIMAAIKGKHKELKLNDTKFGKTPFKLQITVSYTPLQSMQVKCPSFKVILPNTDCDLSFLDEKILNQMLQYIHNCNNELYKHTANLIWDELARRRS